jgi:hypothetical protein
MLIGGRVRDCLTELLRWREAVRLIRFRTDAGEPLAGLLHGRRRTTMAILYRTGGV